MDLNSFDNISHEIRAHSEQNAVQAANGSQPLQENGEAA